MGRPRFIGCAAAALCLISLDLRAQTVTIVARAPSDPPVAAADARAALVGVAQRDGWTTSGDAFAIARARVAAGAVASRRLQGFARARALLAEGWRAYLSVETAFAAARLAEARRVAAGVLDLQGGLELYAELSLRLGVVMRKLGRDGEARDLFRLARTLDPDRELTVAEFAPDVIAAVTEAVAAPAPRVKVRIASQPRGALIVVDGRRLGRAPLDAVLARGQHVLVARAKGRASRGQVFAADKSTTVRVTLDADPVTSALHGQPPAIGTSEADLRLMLTAIMRYGEVDAVLLVAPVWRRGAPALLGQLCRGEPVRCGRTHEIGFPHQARLAPAAEMLWKGVTAEVRAHRTPSLLADARLTNAEPRPGKSVPLKGTRRPWWKRSWLWVGAGTAAFTTAAILLLIRNEPGTPTVIVDPCEFGGC